MPSYAKQLVLKRVQAWVRDNPDKSFPELAVFMNVRKETARRYMKQIGAL